MRYEKPIVIELDRGAQRAKGQDPLACISGDSAAGGLQSCGVGNSAAWSCGGGISPSESYALCYPGTGPGAGADCFTGTAPAGYCGAGATARADPLGCNVGTSN